MKASVDVCRETGRRCRVREFCAGPHWQAGADFMQVQCVDCKRFGWIAMNVEWVAEKKPPRHQKARKATA